MTVHKPTLLFDLDGTLTDPKDGITRCMAYALSKLGLEPPPTEELLWCIGPPLHRNFLKILGEQHKVNDAVHWYRERYTAIGMYENQPYTGIHQTLAALKDAGHRLFVATSKLQTIACDVLEHFELRSFFDNVYGSELDGTRGDKGELITFLLQEEQLPSGSCVMIGDREHDMIGARKNQVRGIGVAWGYGTTKELTDSGAEHIASQPTALIDYFKNIQAG